MNHKILISNLILVLSFSLISCGEKHAATHDSSSGTSIKHLPWTRQAVIYEVNIRQYTPEGSFAAFQKHLPRLKELSVDVLWLMPIHPISQKNRKGTLGSYYAVQDYKGINPEFGTAQDFTNLVDEAHRLGFKMIIDWVANHTGWDNLWIAQHSERYATDSLGNIYSPYDWTDTAKLEYDNEDTRTAMIDAMKYWVENFNIDGFRCDMAHEVPTSFWETARKELDAIKPMFMLAESEASDLLVNAFDANYSWKLMHMMKDVYDGKQNADSIVSYLQKLDTAIVGDAYKMNFLTNHDENSWNGTEFERYGDATRSFAVLCYTINGMPMLYTGQEVGMTKRLEFFEKNQVPSWEENAYTHFYRMLNDLKHLHPALKAGIKGGDFIRQNTSDSKILVYTRKADDRELIVMLNLSPLALEFTSDDLVALEKDAKFTNYFTNKSADSLPRTMEAWEYQIFIN